MILRSHPSGSGRTQNASFKQGDVDVRLDFYPCIENYIEASLYLLQMAGAKMQIHRLVIPLPEEVFYVPPVTLGCDVDSITIKRDGPTRLI